MAKMMKEYGGKETYKSKGAMKRHEGKESAAMERKEKAGKGYKAGGKVTGKMR